MESEEGLKLLFHKLSETEFKENEYEGRKIIRRLGGLALAIDQAAAYIEFNYVGHEPSEYLPRFLPEYEAKRKIVLETIREYFREYVKIDEEDAQEKAISAFTTWEMSFAQIRSTSDPEKEAKEHFLTLSTYFGPAVIKEDLFKCYRLFAEYAPQWTRIFDIACRTISRSTNRPMKGKRARLRQRGNSTNHPTTQLLLAKDSETPTSTGYMCTSCGNIPSYKISSKVTQKRTT